MWLLDEILSDLNSTLWYDVIVWFWILWDLEYEFNQDMVFSGKKIPC